MASSLSLLHSPALVLCHVFLSSLLSSSTSRSSSIPFTPCTWLSLSFLPLFFHSFSIFAHFVASFFHFVIVLAVIWVPLFLSSPTDLSSVFLQLLHSRSSSSFPHSFRGFDLLCHSLTIPCARFLLSDSSCVSPFFYCTLVSVFSFFSTLCPFVSPTFTPTTEYLQFRIRKLVENIAICSRKHRYFGGNRTL